MQDSYGRSISYLRLSVTDACNYRCRYCMPAQGCPSHHEACSYDEFEQFVRATTEIGVTKVRLTGGEPLVRPGIVDFVARLRSIPAIQELVLTTNGCRLPALAHPLKEAGLDRINISLDTLREDRYRYLTRTGQLHEALDGIQAAREAGFTQIKINCVLIGSYNDDEIADFAALARDYPFEVRFIELMPIGPSCDFPSASFVPAERVLDHIPELQPLHAQGVAERFSAPGWKGSIGLIRPMSCKFCKNCSRIRITADGYLKTCLHSAEEVSLRHKTYDELVACLRERLQHKVAEHDMDIHHASQALRTMSRIGG